jgi:hypothetical protein
VEPDPAFSGGEPAEHRGNVGQQDGGVYLRLPNRTRGVVLGMTTLILSPILALTLVSATQSVAGHGTPAPAAAAQTVGHVQGRIAHLAVSELRGPQSETPAPAPAPAPIAKPPVRTSAPPLATGPPASPNSIIGIIEAAAARWGVSGSWMVNIARCESGLRPNAYNPRGPYIGLFQFLQSTFTGNGGTNIYDPADQANIAAKMLAHGQAHQWGCA